MSLIFIVLKWILNNYGIDFVRSKNKKYIVEDEKYIKNAKQYRKKNINKI